MDADTRAWADHVEGVFETSLGTLRFAVTSAEHVHIEGAKAKVGPFTQEPVIINRVPYHMSLHLHRKADGAWDVKDIREVYLSRPSSSKAFDYSLAAVNKARSVVSAAWTQYATEHPEVFKPAELGHLNNDIIRLDEQIAEKEKELSDLKAKRDALLTKETALAGGKA